MRDEDLALTRDDEERALRECVRLGYMMRTPDGTAVITGAGIRRVEGMVWTHAQRRGHLLT